MTGMVTTRTSVDRPVNAAPAPAGRRRPSDFACKQVMALTGVIFGLFVLMHMIGNLKAYLGPQHFDEYAMWLRHLLEPLVPYSGDLWVLRVVLLGCLVGHLGCAYLLTRREMTGEDPLRVPMRIAPGAHVSMGGLWTDFDSMSNLPGLFVGGEASWAYHRANRLGANSLLSACVDGRFTLPLTVPNYLESQLGTKPLALDDPAVSATVDEVRAGVGHLLDIGGSKPADFFHRQLGDVLYDQAG